VIQPSQWGPVGRKKHGPMNQIQLETSLMKNDPFLEAELLHRSSSPLLGGWWPREIH
jgi:hypothetical protein